MVVHCGTGHIFIYSVIRNLSQMSKRGLTNHSGIHPACDLIKATFKQYLKFTQTQRKWCCFWIAFNAIFFPYQSFLHCTSESKSYTQKTVSVNSGVDWRVRGAEIAKVVRRLHGNRLRGWMISPESVRAQDAKGLSWLTHPCYIAIT